MRIIKEILYNPLTEYILWVYRKLKYILKQKNIEIKYMAKIKNTIFEGNNIIYQNTIVDNCTIKKATYIGSNSLIYNADIGKYCSVSSNVYIGLGEHPSKTFISTHPSFYSIKKQSGFSYVNTNKFEEVQRVIIGNDVWIGANVVIRNGVKIGNGVIIAAGSVVVNDIDDYQIVGGIPARLIRYRFNKDEINRLTKLEWWNKKDNWIKKNAHLFDNVSNLTEIERTNYEESKSKYNSSNI